jgi:hypothetical protein
MQKREAGPDDDRNAPGATFFAAYAGLSMNPTLREPEMMEIVPYDGRPVRVGDVVFFLSREVARPVVHRIVRVAPAGISTIGDNNSREDVLLLQPEDIEGQVVAAWRGARRREIAGGLRGRLRGGWLRRRNVLDCAVSRLLHPVYHAVSRSGLIAGVLPAPLRPRVVVFPAQGCDRFRLLLGNHVIGRYDDQARRWQIRRPFRLLVDERALQRQQDASRTGTGCSIEAGEP